ncbi:unnamed protein product, partial [Ectocarpus sp. 6 AP-2014]
MGGGSRGTAGGSSFSSRDSPRGNSNSSANGGGSTPRGSGNSGMGAWGSGRLERSAPAFSASKQQHGGGGSVPQQQHSAGAPGSDGYKMACRDRWMNVTKTMMGERAEITTTSGCVYEGVFHVLTPGEDPRPGAKRGMYRVIMRAAKVQGATDQSNGGQSKIDSRGGTLMLSGEDIVSIAVKRFPMQHSAQRPKGLGTDSDIGGRAGGGSQLGVERKLQAVDTSWVESSSNMSIPQSGGGGAGKWDQFAANEKLFNVTSTFDENLYTTPLDTGSLSRAQMAHAERMAAEIEGKTSSNIHMREERNMLTEQDKAMGEEERFSGVLGTGGMASHQRRSAGNNNNSSNSNGGHHRHSHGQHSSHGGGGRDPGPSAPRYTPARGRVSPQSGPGGP